MILLNLLPPEEKKIITSHQALRRILIWGSFSLILILTFLALLSSVWWFLLIQLSSIEKNAKEIEASAQGRAFQEFKKEVNKINQTLQHFDNLYQATKIYSLALENLSQSVPPTGLKFRKISINQNEVVLEGYAESREVLLSFKEVLERSLYFEKINSPLSNFLKQYNINFSFNFQIK